MFEKAYRNRKTSIKETVLYREGNLVGMVTRKDIHEALTSGKEDISVKEIMASDIMTCYPDENLKTALQKLGEKDVGRIPVVERGNVNHLVGLITRENIITSYNEALLKRKEAELR